MELNGGYGKLPDGLYPVVDPDLDTEGAGSPEVMQGPDELRSCGKGRSHKRRIKSMAKALYRLKTSDVREMIKQVIILLSIVSIVTWETQHIRYSHERKKLLDTMLSETVLQALIEKYERKNKAKMIVYDDKNHFLLFEVHGFEHYRVYLSV